MPVERISYRAGDKSFSGALVYADGVKTKRPLLVTKFGKPIAEVIPPSLNQQSRSWLGSMQGEIKFLGDIVSPVFDERDWKEPGE